MKIKNWILRQLAEKGLIRESYDYYTDAEKQSYDYQQEEFRKLEAGEEIRPPWNRIGEGPIVYMPSWEYDIWRPFWNRLTDKEKQAYLKKYKVPPEDWCQSLVIERTLKNFVEDERLDDQDEFKDAILKHFNLSTRKENRWFLKQKKRLEAGEELEPPWITFPISLPEIGWDDYFLEKWKLEVWIPFWEH